MIMAAATGYLKEVDPARAALARWWVDHGRAAARARPPYEDIPQALVSSLLVGGPRAQGLPPPQLNLPEAFMPGLNKVHLRSAWDDFLRPASRGSCPGRAPGRR